MYQKLLCGLFCIANADELASVRWSKTVPVVLCVDTAVFFPLGVLRYVCDNHLHTFNVSAAGDECCAFVLGSFSRHCLQPCNFLNA